jgi:mono/diheme cytochrome c family protein
MPAFGGILSDAQIDELVEIVKAFAPRRFATPPVPVTRPAPPATREDAVQKGQALFSSAGCVSCHGASGRGDGPAAAGLRDDRHEPAPPFDLTARPLRRGKELGDIVLTLVTGLDGTAMPSYQGALSPGELWALASYVDRIRWKGAVPTWDATAVDPRIQRTLQPTSWHPGERGPAPASLPPAAASLSAAQCGRCHAKQLREWKRSLHAHATSPGLLAQLLTSSAATVASCQRCHAPLLEQRPGDTAYEDALRAQGTTCAACHLAGHVRHGPPRRPDTTLLGLPSYPFVEDARYERSDFCLPCHQLAPADAVNGRPLLNTYREWLEGPYMPRGVQCQHCHMPDREHSWKGVHDPETVRQGLDIHASAHREKGEVRVRIDATNIGAAHYLPTTPTPAAWIEATLLDGAHEPLGKPETQRIGRHIEYVKKGWIEHEDTRIPPGQTLTFAPIFAGKSAAQARHVRVSVRFAPDDYYEGFYRRFLSRPLRPDVRALFERALELASSSGFVVFQRVLALPGP